MCLQYSLVFASTAWLRVEERFLRALSWNTFAFWAGQLSCALALCSLESHRVESYVNLILLSHHWTQAQSREDLARDFRLCLCLAVLCLLSGGWKFGFRTTPRELAMEVPHHLCELEPELPHVDETSGPPGVSTCLRLSHA